MLAKLQDAALLPTIPIAAKFLSCVSRSQEPLAIFPASRQPQRAIGSFLLPSTAEKVSAGALDSPTPLIDLENVGPWGELADVTNVESIASSRIRFNQDCLITTRLRPYLQKTVLLKQDGAIGSPEWISVRVKSDVLRPRLLFYILQSSRFTELASTLSSGKEHPRITQDILERLKIPWLPLDIQDKILSRLDPLLEESSALMRTVDTIDRPLNDYFEERLGLKVDLIDPNREAKRLNVALTDVACHRDARFSFKFLSPSVRAARFELEKRSTRRLRELLAEPAVLGDSVSPDDYSTGTGFFYVSMVALKRWRVESYGLNQVTEEYYHDHEAKWIMPGDVLMARSGEGTIGKVGLVPDGLTGVCADFVIRMRPNEKMLRSAFLHYCLMSRYYQHLIFGEKKGLGNNTNIFPIQIHEFPIIDMSPEDQDSMVRDLNAIVNKYDRNVDKARALRDEIDQRLIEALTN